MRLLFLHEVNYLEKPMFEMHEIPELLSSLGHEVAFAHFPEGLSLKDARRLGPKKVVPARSRNGSEITLYTPACPGRGIGARLLGVLLARRFLRKVISDFRPEVIVSYSIPTSGWQALKLAKNAQIPFVYRAIDSSSEIRGGVFSLPVKIAEKHVVRNADFISANNPEMKRYCQKLGANQHTTFVHLPPLDISALSEGDRDLGREKLGIPTSARVMLFLGSLFEFSGLDEALDYFARVHQSLGVKFVIVGDGKLFPRLSQQIRRLDLEGSVVLTGKVDREHIPNLLASADVLLNTLRARQVTNVALPNKLIEYLAANRPVVSTRLKGAYELFGDLNTIVWAKSPRQVVEEAAAIVSNLEVAMADSQGDRLEDMFGRPAVEKIEEFLFSVVASS